MPLDLNPVRVPCGLPVSHTTGLTSFLRTRMICHRAEECKPSTKARCCCLLLKNTALIKVMHDQSSAVFILFYFFLHCDRFTTHEQARRPGKAQICVMMMMMIHSSESRSMNAHAIDSRPHWGVLAVHARVPLRQLGGKSTPERTGRIKTPLHARCS